ncbi:SET domain-containing protein [Rosistilla oblonga]|uniref:SET domain-containing protein n=1 Tax=Rosistilla oblonga TaxID=2527990 RepID=UPI003A97CD14
MLNSETSPTTDCESDPAVNVQSTPIGKGVFADREFRAHDVIGWITGKIHDDPEYGSEYCIDVGGTATLEPDAPFRFLNHCCEPNSQFTWDELEEDSDAIPEVYLLALRDIEAGEQLTIDYNWAADCAIPCHCGAETCRGWIVTLDEIDQLPAKKQQAR